MDVDVDGQFGFMASATFGLAVADVADPMFPVIRSSSDVPFHGEHGAIADSVAVVGGRTPQGVAHLWVLDVGDADAPRVVGELSTSILAGPQSGFQDLALDATGTLAVAAMGVDGLWVLDVNDPEAPIVRGSLGGTDVTYGVALNEDATLAYMADGRDGLRVVSLLDPDNPTLLGTAGSFGTLREVAVVGQTAYAVNQNGGMFVFDVSNPNLPSLVRWVQSSGPSFHLAAEGSLLAILSLSSSSPNDYLDLFDLSPDPRNPVLITSVAVTDVGEGTGVDLDGGLAYVATLNEGLKIYDLDSPGVPLNVVPIAGTEGHDITVQAPHVFVADFPATLSIISLGD